jgi:hypothetical protein
MKTEILHTIQIIVQFDTLTTRFQSLRHLEPFRLLFIQFDDLNTQNKKSILHMIELVLREGALSPEEWKSLCQLLQGKRPSTLLMAFHHLTFLVQKHLVNRDELRRAGLISILVDYLVLPSDLPCAQMLEIDSEEVQLCLLLSNTPTSNKFADNKTEKIQHILYAISQASLKMLILSLTANLENQILFRERFFFLSFFFFPLLCCLTLFSLCSNGVKRLYRLLTDNHLRSLSLHALSLVAIGDHLLECRFQRLLPLFLVASLTHTHTHSLSFFFFFVRRIIPDMVQVLQSYGGTAVLDPDILYMRKDILSSLCFIFQHNENAKNAFRSGGGFIWVVSVLDGIVRCCVGAQSADSSGFFFAHSK